MKKRTVCRLFFLIVVFLSFKSHAQNEIFEFKIPSQPLSSALVEFSNISKSKFIVPGDLTNGLVAPAVDGKLTAEQAIKTLLAGSGLIFTQNKKGTFLIKKKPKPVLAAPTPQLEEVFITALKREQSLQDSPVSVSTIDGLSLSERGKTNTRDLFLVTPSMAFHGAINAAGQGMRIRGIGSGVIASGVEQSVGTIIDGVVTGPSGSGLQELWDVERVEVLRGPQGTLFGKNVSAGAINQVTVDPTEKLDLFASGRYEFEYDATRIDAAISGPLSAGFTGRLSGFYLDQKEGNIENVVLDETENNKGKSGVRGKLHYDTEEWWSHLSVSYDELDERCCGRVFSHLDEDSSAGRTLTWVIPALEGHGVEANRENRIAISEGPLREKAETWHIAWENGIDFDSHKFKSITGYRNWQHQSENDGDNLDTDTVSFVSDKRKLELYSQEFQLISQNISKLEYVLGAYFYHQSFDSTEYIAGGVDFTGSFGSTDVKSHIEINNAALFGHTTYHFTQTFAGFGGLRLLHEEVSAEGQQDGGVWFWPTDYERNEVSVDDSDYAGVLGLQYHPSADHKFYTSLSRGYKGHAVGNSSNSIFFRAPLTTQNGETLTADEAILDPETVISYEIGSKNFFLNHNAQINATAFYSRFSNFQASAYDGNINAFQLTNAGTIDTRGVELEFQLLPWAGAHVSGFITWVNAEFSEFKGAPCKVSQSANESCSAATQGQDLSGEQVNETPEWQFALNFRQDFSTQLGTLFFASNYSWRDDVIFDPDLDENTMQEAYGLLDIRIGLQSYKGVDFSIFVNNVTNEDYAHRYIDAPMWPGAFQRYPGDERTYGFELSYRLQ